MRAITDRLTYANIVATLALVVALGGGTAYAAPSVASKLHKNSVTTKSIKNSAVTGAKLHADAVTSAKVADGSLLARDFKAGQLPQGAKGEPGSGLGTYAESVGMNLALTPSVAVVASTDSAHAPASSGAWYGALGFPKNGALIGTASADVETTGTGSYSCDLRTAPPGSSYDTIATMTSDTASLTIVRPFVRLSTPTAPGPAQHYDVVCNTSGTRHVTDVHLAVVGTFRAG